MTPLHRAAREGHEHVVLELLQKGANVNMKDDLGRTPLAMAIANGSSDIIDELFKKHAEVNYVYSIPWQQDESIKRMLQQKRKEMEAKIRLAEFQEWVGNLGGYEFRGPNGAERVRPWEEELERWRRQWRRTPLLRAQETKNYDAVKLLLEAGADSEFGDGLLPNMCDISSNNKSSTLVMPVGYYSG